MSVALPAVAFMMPTLRLPEEVICTEVPEALTTPLSLLPVCSSSRFWLDETKPPAPAPAQLLHLSKNLNTVGDTSEPVPSLSTFTILSPLTPYTVTSPEEEMVPEFDTTGV